MDGLGLSNYLNLNNYTCGAVFYEFFEGKMTVLMDTEVLGVSCMPSHNFLFLFKDLRQIIYLYLVILDS